MEHSRQIQRSKWAKKGNQLIMGTIRGVFTQRTSVYNFWTEFNFRFYHMNAFACHHHHRERATFLNGQWNEYMSLSFRFWNSVVVYKFLLSSPFLPYYPLIVDFHPFLIDRVTSAASLALNLGADSDCLVNQMQNIGVLESCSTNIYQPQCNIMQVFLDLQMAQLNVLLSS